MMQVFGHHPTINSPPCSTKTPPVRSSSPSFIWCLMIFLTIIVMIKLLVRKMKVRLVLEILGLSIMLTLAVSQSRTP